MHVVSKMYGMVYSKSAVCVTHKDQNLAHCLYFHVSVALN